MNLFNYAGAKHWAIDHIDAAVAASGTVPPELLITLRRKEANHG